MPASTSHALLDRFAFWVSALLSPFLVFPVLLIALAWQEASSLYQFGLWVSAVLLFTALIPLCYVYAQIRTGKISDLHIMHREQRLSVFLIVLASTALGALVFWWLHVSHPLVVVVELVFVSALIAMLITLVWKISIHSWALAGAITAYALLSGNTYIWWLLAAIPLVIWSRIYRERHDLWQGLAGALAGGILTAGLIAILL